MFDKWYVSTTWTSKEDSYLKQIQNYNFAKGINGISLFVPKKEFFFIKRGEPMAQVKPMFKGYIFFETKMETYEFLSYFNKLVRDLMWLDFLYLLRYGDTRDSLVRRGEQLALLQFMNDKRIMEISRGYKEGDKVKIINGALTGFESNIVYINTHKMQAAVEVQMMGRCTIMTVGLEMIEKVNE